MDTKLTRIKELKVQRQKLDEEITKLEAEATAELESVLNAGKKPRKPRNGAAQATT